MYDVHHHAWYFHIPSDKKARIAAILGITGVVNPKLQAVTERRVQEGWGKASRFANRDKKKPRKKGREPASVGGGRG